MTTTPPEASGPAGPDGPHDAPHESGPGPSTSHDSGPRVTADEVRDLSRLRRTVGAHRHVAGVGGGVARHLDVDPLLVRVLFVVATLFGGAGLVVYVGLWLLVPEDGAEAAPVPTTDRVRQVALVALAVIGALLLLGDAVGPGDGWPLAVVAALVGVVLLATRSGGGPAVPPGATYSEYTPEARAGVDPSGTVPTEPFGTSYAGPIGYAPPPPDPRRAGPRLFAGTLALVLLGWGVLSLLDVTGTELPGAAYPALALATVGAALVLAARWGRGGGLILLGSLALLALTAATVVDRVDAPTRTITPTSADALPERWSWSAGDYTLDLTDVPVADLDGRDLRIESGVGRVRVVVPAEADVSTRASVGLGGIDLYGIERGGPGQELTFELDGTGDEQFDLDVQLGVGAIEIVQEER